MKRNSALKKLALNRRRRLSFSLCSLQNTNMDESAAKTLPVSAASCPSEASPAKALRSLEHLSLSVCPQSLGVFFSHFRNVASARSQSLIQIRRSDRLFSEI